MPGEARGGRPRGQVESRRHPPRHLRPIASTPPPPPHPRLRTGRGSLPRCDQRRRADAEMTRRADAEMAQRVDAEVPASVVDGDARGGSGGPPLPRSAGAIARTPPAARARSLRPGRREEASCSRRRRRPRRGPLSKPPAPASPARIANPTSRTRPLRAARPARRPPARSARRHPGRPWPNKNGERLRLSCRHRHSVILANTNQSADSSQINPARNMGQK